MTNLPLTHLGLTFPQKSREGILIAHQSRQFNLKQQPQREGAILGNNFFTRNIELLQKHHPITWRVVQEFSEPPGWEIFFSSSGKPNLRAKNSAGNEIIFHDLDNPDVDNDYYLTKTPKDSTAVVVMIGMGLGYIPLALLQHRPLIRNFVIFETNPAIFLQALKVMDLSPLLCDSKVAIHLGTQEDIEAALSPAARGIQLENTHIFRHLPSFEYSGSYLSLNEKIYNYINALNVGGATALKQGRNFTSNRFQNFTVLRHNRTIDDLTDAFVGIPAVLVAAGPSLDKNIHLLKNIKDNALIITVDTALPSLLAHGIMPDFISSIDGDEVIYEKIADCASLVENVSLICQCHVTDKIAKCFPAKQIFWCFGNNPIEEWVFKSLYGEDASPRKMGSWSVAHLNLAVAIAMGTSPIIFVGQDLAYTDFRDHAAHTVLTDKQFMEKILNNKQDDMVFVEGWEKGKVPTSRGFYGVIKHFEEMIAANPGPYYINATEGGARINGSVPLSLQLTLERYCAIPRGITARIESCIHHAPPPTANLIKAAGSLLQQVVALKKRLVKSNTTTTTILKKINKLLKNSKKYTTFSDLPPELQKLCAEIDDRNREIDNANLVWFLLQEITLPGLKESERQRQEINAIRNDKDMYTEWLTRTIKLTEYINTTRLSSLDFFQKILIDFSLFQKNESKIEKATKQFPASSVAILELINFYILHERYALARPYLQSLSCLPTKDSAEFHFLFGCIASTQRDEATATKHFQNAITLAPSYEPRLRIFRKKQGDAFIRYAEEYRDLDRGTFKKMLFKGLSFCPDHAEIIKELSQCAQQELADLTTNALTKKEQLILDWHDRLKQHPSLAHNFDPELTGALRYHYGCLMALTQDYAAARQWIEQAIALQPKNPEYHASMVSVLFDTGTFEAGLVHLKKAVELDRRYGRQWEEIGDSLQEAGQHVDAIAAYEQCILALPDRSGVLKKIGDCYLHMGQLEAAKAAYEQFKAAHAQDAS